MVRPIYETDQDIQNESEVAHAVSRKCNCEVRKLKKLFACDYVGLRNRNIVSFLEIKVRNNAHDKYPTYMISADKVWKSLSMAMAFERPFFLVVSFTDGIYYTGQFPSEEMSLTGRYDRNDGADVEPCLMIPMVYFKKLV